jgi:hypothetical protein
VADEDDIYMRPDVPTTGAIVKTQDEARTLAKRISGDAPNEMLFKCVMCDFKQTLRFEDDEIEALGGDISTYGGPCPKCKSMTLVPMSQLFPDFLSAEQRARRNRKEEFTEAAEVFTDVVAKKVGSLVTGSTLDPTPEETGLQDPDRSDLPSADDVDLSGLKPRGEG